MSISIIAVNWNSYDFANLLIHSINKFSDKTHEIIIIDNSENIKPLKGCKLFVQDKNIGHGKGLNLGVSLATCKYVLFLDIDCMLIDNRWENLFLKSAMHFDLIAAKGSPSKPIRPACMFLERELAAQHDFSDTPGYKGNRITPEGFDVAIKAYLTMLKQGKTCRLLDSSPKEQRKFKTLNGEEYQIDRIPVVYHHWHGSNLKGRQYDYKQNLEQDKRNLFKSIGWNFTKMI